MTFSSPPKNQPLTRTAILACSACAAWFQKPDDKMTPFGYGCCPHLPAGQYLTPEAFCRLPGKFNPRPKHPRAKGKP